MEGWLLWAGQACWHGWSAASSAMTFASSLQPSCRQSVAHALLTCGGATPAYFTPGFAPLGLAWGWLLVGLLLGALASKAVERFATRAWQLPAPPVAAARRPAASGAVCHDANPSARDHATAGPPPHAPSARQRQYQPPMTGTCPTVWLEL